MTPPLPLLDKVAIVTGGSRGIGAGIAIEIAKRGANILITYNTARDKAEKVAQDIEQLGRQVVIIQGSGSDRDAPDRIVQAAVASYGKIDIIINNAGVSGVALLKDLTHDHWDNMYDTNIRLPAFLVKAALPYFGPAPRVINISSVVSSAGYSTTSVYASSKLALEAMTRVWATELGKEYNAVVICVNPGPVETEMMMANEDAEVMKYWDAKIKETPAAPRIGTPDDIAQIVAFLCEQGSRWCTGSVIHATGGLFAI